MSDRHQFGRAFFVVSLTVVGAQAVHWLMTLQDHPDATPMRTVGVYAQALFAFGAALWAGFRKRPLTSGR